MDQDTDKDQIGWTRTTSGRGRPTEDAGEARIASTRRVAEKIAARHVSCRDFSCNAARCAHKDEPLLTHVSPSNVVFFFGRRFPQVTNNPLGHPRGTPGKTRDHEG